MRVYAWIIGLLLCFQNLSAQNLYIDSTAVVRIDKVSVNAYAVYHNGRIYLPDSGRIDFFGRAWIQNPFSRMDGNGALAVMGAVDLTIPNVSIPNLVLMGGYVNMATDLEIRNSLIFERGELMLYDYTLSFPNGLSIKNYGVRNRINFSKWSVGKIKFPVNGLDSLELPIGHWGYKYDAIRIYPKNRSSMFEIELQETYEEFGLHLNWKLKSDEDVSIDVDLQHDFSAQDRCYDTATSYVSAYNPITQRWDTALTPDINAQPIGDTIGGNGEFEVLHGAKTYSLKANEPLLLTKLSASRSVTLSNNTMNNIAVKGTPITFTASPPTAQSYDFKVDGHSYQQGASSQFTTNRLEDGNMIQVQAVYADGCTQFDNQTIYLIDIPNAFTPYNVDGRNDFFMQGYSIEIYNAWGQTIFKGDDGWDGTHNGKLVPPDVYYYTISIKSGENVDAAQFRGSVKVLKK